MFRLCLPSFVTQSLARARLNPTQRAPRRAAYPLILVLAVVTTGACTTAAAQTPASALPTPVPPMSLMTMTPAKPAHADVSPISGPRVDVENFNFVPATLTVQAGSTVTWVNHDDAPHTITASDKSFSSLSLETDAQFSFKFDKPGTYTYFCAIHPFMTASVTVQ
jgi:plastocyanin